MSLSKELACWHEAGHTIRAYYLNPASIQGPVLHLAHVGGGRWAGQAGVDLSQIDPFRRLDVALAGLFAEALFKGFDHPASGGAALLCKDQRALDGILLGYYGADRTDEVRQQQERLPVWVRTGDGVQRPVAAGVSFEDLDLIPGMWRKPNLFRRSFRRLRQFFTQYGVWRNVTDLAKGLDQWNWAGAAPFDYLEVHKATGLTFPAAGLI